MSAARDEPAARARPNPGSFAATALQLALLLAAIRAYGLEEAFGLVALAPVVFLGFCVHAWLPPALKPPAFLAISLAALVVVLGAADAARVAGIALALFGICHLPVRVALRALLLVLAGAGLAVLRAGWIETSWARVVLPVVAAMFMFRGAVYLYDTRTEQRAGTAPASVWLRLSYFFLLPNVCFLLFPVVDYRTFRRTYYERPASEIHRRGIRWILRGLVHLLLYRLVYSSLAPDLAAVRDAVGVAAFVVSSYLLYLRISGQFHLIVGLLHLFGFHLPETNHDWLLASSFTDTWRRINVYWTELMKKLVYYPTFVRLRRPGSASVVLPMVGATVATFLATWLLHDYQWFWLHGSLLLATDGLFWGLAGALALATMLWEAKRPPRRRLGRGVPSWRRALRRSVQTFGVFVSICLIWSLWCCSSLDQWLAILSQAGNVSRAQALALGGGAGGLVLAGTALQRFAHLGRSARARLGDGGRAALVTASAAALLLLGLAPVRTALGPTVVAALEPFGQERLNARDSQRMVAGYYDRLIEREGFGGRATESARPDLDDPRTFQESPVSERLGAPLLYGILPSKSVDYLGARFESNRWGMRDREYELAKPPGTYRIAVLGTCYETGPGVSNADVWEAVAEERLNRELSPRTGLAYEILNFSVPGYSLLHQVAVMREQVARFTPDLVVLSNHVRSDVKYLIELARTAPCAPPGLAEVFEHLGLTPGMGELAVRRRVGPERVWIESWALGRIAEASEAIDAVPVLLNVPFLEYGVIGAEVYEARIAELEQAARERGFEQLDIGSAFEGEPFESVALARLQHCPSARGHRLMAERFVEALLGEPAALGVP